MCPRAYRLRLEMPYTARSMGRLLLHGLDPLEDMCFKHINADKGCLGRLVPKDERPRFHRAFCVWPSFRFERGGQCIDVLSRRPFAVDERPCRVSSRAHEATVSSGWLELSGQHLLRLMSLIMPSTPCRLVRTHTHNKSHLGKVISLHSFILFTHNSLADSFSFDH